MTSRIDAQGQQIEIEAEGVFQFDPPRGVVSMSVPQGGDMETAFEGTTVYVRGPEGFGDVFGTDTPWISFDFVRAGASATGVDMGGLSGLNGDPTQGLALLKGASDDIEELGTEDVRGVETTHYRATIDIERAFREQGEVTDPDQFERFLDTLGATTIPVDVWIDDEGRVRRQSYEHSVPGGKATATMELYDFGTDEPIELPSPEEVTDVTDRMAALAGG